MSYDIPDDGEGLSRIQSIVFQEDLEVAINYARAGTYVKSGGVVTAQGVPNLTVAVAACVVYSQGFRFPVAASASLAIATADLTNPRLDAIVVTTAGVLAVRTGVAVAFTSTTTPKPAVLSLGDVMLAQVFVPALALAINTANIKDRRVLVPNLDWAQTETGSYDNYLSAMPVSTTNTVSIRGGPGVTSGGTISHPTPTAGRITQLLRTRYANVATTVDQALGWWINGASAHKYWRGNAANLGGFYYRGKMSIELWTTGSRYFQGMDSLGACRSISNTLTGDICGLWHDTTMADTVLNFITRDNTTTTLVPITLSAPMATGQGYELIMYCKPNDTIMYYKVIDMLTGNTLADSFTSTTLPRNTVFLGPQQNMSNGANAVVTTVAPGVVEMLATSPAIRT